MMNTYVTWMEATKKVEASVKTYQQNMKLKLRDTGESIRIID